MSETPEPTVAGHGARLALAFLVSSLVLAVGLVFQGGYQVFTGMGPVAHTVLSSVGIGLTALTVVMALVGIAVLVMTLRQAVSATRRPALIVAAIVGVLVLLFWVVLLAFVPFIGMGLLLLVGASLGAAIVTAAGPPFTMPRGARRHAGRRVALAVGLALANLALIACGTLHIVLWNPLARVPGWTIEQIYAELAARGEGGGWIMVVAWAAIWGLASIALAVVGSLPRMATALTARRMMVLGLLLIGVTVFFHWMAGFGMGMSLADTFATSGGDAAVSGPILALMGQLALVAALFIALVPPRGKPQGAIAPAPAGSGVSPL